MIARLQIGPYDALFRLEKITYAVRQARVSWQNGGPINGPPKTPQYGSAVMV